MKTKILYSLLTVCALLLTSCNYDEDELQPSGVLTSYQLPQGNHDYDQTIKDFYDKYGKYLLYDFTEKDACWTPNGWKNFIVKEEYEANTQPGYLVKPADQSYVKQQIALLDEVWFSKLSEKVKKDLLPVKILLCSEVDSCYIKSVYNWDFSTTPISYTIVITPYYPDVKGWYNYDNICVGWGNNAITSITDAQKKSFAYKIFHEWPTYFCERQIKPTEEFANSIDYTAVKNPSSSYIGPCCEKGILSATYNATPESDWKAFIIMMLNYSEDWINDPTIAAPGQYAGWSSATSFHEGSDYRGILSSVKDTNGLLKKRYQMVREYFIENYDMDLQTIGNTMFTLN